jgi:hypothetical protein
VVFNDKDKEKNKDYYHYVYILGKVNHDEFRERRGTWGKCKGSRNLPTR